MPRRLCLLPRLPFRPSRGLQTLREGLSCVLPDSTLDASCFSLDTQLMQPCCPRRCDCSQPWPRVFNVSECQNAVASVLSALVPTAS